MGVSIQIRDVDEDVRDRLKARAAEDGVSLNALLRGILTRESQVPSRATVLARLQARGNLIDSEVSAVVVIAAARAEREAELAAGRAERHTAAGVAVAI